LSHKSSSDFSLWPSGFQKAKSRNAKENRFRGYQPFVQKAIKELGSKYPAQGLITRGEIQLLGTGEYRVLDIKKMVVIQFRSETNLQKIFNQLKSGGRGIGNVFISNFGTNSLTYIKVCSIIWKK